MQIRIKQKQECMSVVPTTVIGVGSAFNILDNYWLLSGMILMLRLMTPCTGMLLILITLGTFCLLNQLQDWGNMDECWREIFDISNMSMNSSWSGIDAYLAQMLKQNGLRSSSEKSGMMLWFRQIFPEFRKVVLNSSFSFLIILVASRWHWKKFVPERRFANKKIDLHGKNLSKTWNCLNKCLTGWMSSVPLRKFLEWGGFVIF